MNMELANQQTMEMENPQVLELSAEQMSEQEQRRTEIEQTFDYDGYQVARRELFAHLRDPAIYNKERQHHIQHGLHCRFGGCGVRQHHV